MRKTHSLRSALSSGGWRLSSTTERGAGRQSGIGRGFVRRGWIIGFTAGLLVLAGLLLYSLWAFWPSGLTAHQQWKKVGYFGGDFTIRTETLFFAVVAFAGALGGLVHTLRSFSMYVGTRSLRWSWIPFNLLLPVVGALGGTVFYLVFRGGLFSTSSSSADIANPYGFAAIAALVGLFSEQAMEKLRQIAREMFAEAPKFEPDHFTESPGLETGTATDTGGAPK